MPVTDSGTHIPTDEHLAILREAGMSLQETMNLPALFSNPLSPLPVAPPAWQEATPQHLRYEHLGHAFFGSPSKYGKIIDFSLQSWVAFLEKAGIAIDDYSESQRVPGLMRCHVINEQIKRGKLQLLTDGTRYLVVAKPSVHTPMCSDLPLQSWNKDLCCPLCHEDKAFIAFPLAGSDPLQGKQGKRWIMGCCRAEFLLPDYHVNKCYSVEQLRTHDKSETIDAL